MLRPSALTLLLLASVSTPLWAQSDPVVIKRPADLRDAPMANARSLVALAAQTPVNRLSLRQGAWVQVRTASGQTGWVHLFDIGSGATPAAPSNTATGALRGLSNFFNRGSAQGSAPHTAATSTVGIRGLSGEDIANAQPDVAAVTQAESLRMDANQAKRFAAEASINARTVEPLPVPSSPATQENKL